MCNRTSAPCGMPKGESKISLVPGSMINVSWHLGYPHRGKYIKYSNVDYPLGI